jgi:hypothetical protein
MDAHWTAQRLRAELCLQAQNIHNVTDVRLGRKLGSLQCVLAIPVA